MLNVVITVDCDFDGYYPFENRISFNKNKFNDSIDAAIAIIKSHNLPACFLIHTSIYIRKYHSNLFYSKPEYLEIWKQLYDYGFELGLHPHEEDPNGRYYYYYYPKYMAKIIKAHCEYLKNAGINATAVRFGYFTISEWTIPVLEKNNIFLSFDPMGGYLSYTSNHFETAPLHQYFYSYKNKERAGNSRVLAVPLGMTGNKRLWNGLIPEANSVESQIALIDGLLNESGKYADCGGLAVNLLIHSYNSIDKNKNIDAVINYMKSKVNLKFTSGAAVLKNMNRQNSK